jgi:hypothetical protein
VVAVALCAARALEQLRQKQPFPRIHQCCNCGSSLTGKTNRQAPSQVEAALLLRHARAGRSGGASLAARDLALQASGSPFMPFTAVRAAQFTVQARLRPPKAGTRIVDPCQHRVSAWQRSITIIRLSTDRIVGPPRPAGQPRQTREGGGGGGLCRRVSKRAWGYLTGCRCLRPTRAICFSFCRASK